MSLERCSVCGQNSNTVTHVCSGTPVKCCSSLPHAQSHPPVKCPVCDGCGTVRERCRTCEGRGVV